MNNDTPPALAFSTHTHPTPPPPPPLQKKNTTTPPSLSWLKIWGDETTFIVNNEPVHTPLFTFNIELVSQLISGMTVSMKFKHEQVEANSPIVYIVGLGSMVWLLHYDLGFMGSSRRNNHSTKWG